jgi:hypothetical protein
MLNGTTSSQSPEGSGCSRSGYKCALSKTAHDWNTAMPRGGLADAWGLGGNHHKGLLALLIVREVPDHGSPFSGAAP